MDKIRLLLTPMILLFSCISLFAQTRTITGKVKDNNGSPVSNAWVEVKGSTLGITSKVDGSFSLSAPLTTSAIVVSSPGMITQELPVNSSTTSLTVTLNRLARIELGAPQIATINNGEMVLDDVPIVVEEMVAIPYGSIEKRSITGSIGQVKSKQFIRRPLTNTLTAIEGQFAGVVTTNQSGQPGAAPNIRIRGFGTFNNSAEPLLIVDGVPYIGNTSNINPADVESMTVLKDAASSAIYGSRGGNGVILITTKKGRRGSGITLRVSQGVVSRGLKEYDRLDARQYYPIMWEAYRNSLLYPAFGVGISVDSANRVASGLTSRTHIYNLLEYNPFNVANNAIVGTNGELNPSAQLLYGNDLDWTSELFRNAPRSDYYINFNGGSEKTDYLFSMGYVKENGYMLNTDFKRYSARLNLNTQALSWLKIGINLSSNYSEVNLAQDTGSTQQVNPFNFTRNIGPIYPVYAHDMTTGAFLKDSVTGQPFYDLGNFGGSFGIPNRTLGAFAGRHALAETTLDQELAQRTSLSARNYLEIPFLNNFIFRNNLSIDYQAQDNTSYNNPVVGDGAPLGSSLKETISNFAFVASQLLYYSTNIEAHSIDGVAGHESFSQRINSVSGFKQGQTVGGNVDLPNFTTINSTTSFTDRYKIESYFARLNYGFDEKYLVSATYRTDGNSVFSSDTRWGSFWSIGGGWNLSNESFLGNINWLDLLKLRTSYGRAGVVDGTGSASSAGFYAYQGLYNFANNANEPGIVQSQTQTLMNPNLKWENNTQFNIGIDFHLFRSRVSGSIDYFNRTSSDLLFAIPQPLSSGVLSVVANSATMKNNGIEATLSGDIIRSKSLLWNATVNLSTLTNTITEMPEDVSEFVTGTKRYAEDQSIFDFWLPSYYGVDSADGAALYKAANTQTVANRRIKVNKSGGSDTLTILASNALFEYQGTAIPDLYGSLTQSVSYKGFTLNALLTFQLGGKTFDANYQGLMSSGTYGAALSTDILNRWKQPGDVTEVPRLDAARTTDYNAASSRWLIDASYLNIRAVSIAYSLPDSFISKWSITNAEIFVSAENLAFFSKRKGLNNHQDFSGVTSNAYPPSRIISIGFILNR